VLSETVSAFCKAQHNARRPQGEHLSPGMQRLP
jgi:hypothetical protein